jgi:hypothetical protein
MTPRVCFEVLMTSFVRPIHVAVALFVVGVFGASAVVLATASGSDEPADRGALLVTATFVRNSLYASNDGLQPTPEPALPPAAPLIASDLPSPVDQPPPADPQPPPPPRTCDEIRADGTYVDDAEREYFLESCVETSAAPSEVTRPASRSAVLTESERAYKVRAESIAYSYLTSFQRYPKDEVTSSASALVEYGGLAGGWANQMDNFAPVPSRFKAAQDRLQMALWELAAHTRLVATGQDSLENPDYLSQLDRLIGVVDSAVGDYVQVLGLTAPQA